MLLKISDLFRIDGASEWLILQGAEDLLYKSIQLTNPESSKKFNHVLNHDVGAQILTCELSFA